jgi:hypothetical protein
MFSFCSKPRNCWGCRARAQHGSARARPWERSMPCVLEASALLLRNCQIEKRLAVFQELVKAAHRKFRTKSCAVRAGSSTPSMSGSQYRPVIVSPGEAGSQTSTPRIVKPLFSKRRWLRSRRLSPRPVRQECGRGALTIRARELPKILRTGLPSTRSC